MIELMQEGPGDGWEVEALYDLCFAPGREALSSYRLRDGVPPVPELCLVARENGILAGALRTWPVRIGRGAVPVGDAGSVGDGLDGDGPGGDGLAGGAGDGGDGPAASGQGGLAQGVSGQGVFRQGGAPALLLGPVAVHPTHQGEGLGAWLIRECLERAHRAGHARMMLVGDAPYYSRFGFARLDGVEMPPPTNPDRVLGLDLQDGAWAGVAGEVTRAAPAGE